MSDLIPTMDFDPDARGEQLLQFQAYVKSARINVHGEVHIQIAVPYEDKYAALPLTDIRGVMFVMGIYQPVGVETGDDLLDMLDIEQALDEVPDINPKTLGKMEREKAKGQDGRGKATHHLRLVQLDYDPFVMADSEDDDGDFT
jgi:hypothetical protein